MKRVYEGKPKVNEAGCGQVECSVREQRKLLNAGYFQYFETHVILQATVTDRSSNCNPFVVELSSQLLPTECEVLFESKEQEHRHEDHEL